MSKDIFETETLQVTAFVGMNGKACVQIGLKGDASYSQLNEEETLELTYALLSRYLRKEGYRATDI